VKGLGFLIKLLGAAAATLGAGSLLGFNSDRTGEGGIFGLFGKGVDFINNSFLDKALTAVGAKGTESEGLAKAILTALTMGMAGGLMSNNKQWSLLGAGKFVIPIVAAAGMAGFGALTGKFNDASADSVIAALDINRANSTESSPSQLTDEMKHSLALTPVQTSAASPLVDGSGNQTLQGSAAQDRLGSTAPIDTLTQIAAEPLSSGALDTSKVAAERVMADAAARAESLSPEQLRELALANADALIRSPDGHILLSDAEGVAGGLNGDLPVDEPTLESMDLEES